MKSKKTEGKKKSIYEKRPERTSYRSDKGGLKRDASSEHLERGEGSSRFERSALSSRPARPGFNRPGKPAGKASGKFPTKPVAKPAAKPVAKPASRPTAKPAARFAPITILKEEKSKSPYFNSLSDSNDPESLVLEGRKAVLEALNHEKPVDRLLIRKDSDKPVEGTLRVIAAKARERGLVVREVTRAKLDEISETGHHQGVIALCPAVGYVEISEILDIAKQKGEQPFVIVLDGVTDPHNLGAVIRTAEAAGAHGVIVPKRRAVGLTGTVAKTSAGAIEHMPVARVTNISQALGDLKKAGLWIACADMEGQNMYDVDLNGPVALVLGAEGEGVSRLVAEKSDFAVRIPMFGKIASLNVSVAAGVLIYEVIRRRSR